MKPRRLLDRQVAGLRALENLVDVRGRTVEEIGKILAVTHQSADLHVFTLREHRRQPVCERKLGNSLPLPEEHGIAIHHDRCYALVGERIERPLDFLWVTCLYWCKRKASFLRRVCTLFSIGG